MTGLVVAAVTLGACVRKDPPKEAYGLTRVELVVEPENLAKLNATVWAKVPFSGEVIIGGRRIKTDLSYSGKSTIDAHKKSYELTLAAGERFRDRTSYRLYAAIMDSSGVKSEIGYKFFKAASLESPATEPAALYLNDTYKGVYTLLEPVDVEFLEIRGISVKNLLKMQYGNAEFSEENLRDPDTAFDPKSDPEFHGDLMRLIEAVNRPNSEQNLADLGNMLDLDQLFRYVAVAVLLNHWDGFKNNIFLYRAKGSQPFRFVPWDLDRIYDEEVGHGDYRPGVDLYGHGALLAKLMSYPELKTRYLEVLRSTIKNVMPLADLTTAIDQASAKITAAFAADPVMSSEGRTAQGEAEALKAAATRWYTQVERDLGTQ